MIGRLGKGELRLTTGGNVKKLHIEGGFAQVRSDVVTVLTSKVTKVG
jgi:F-type H+-transporting ATPase subunit epsilon